MKPLHAYITLAGVLIAAALTVAFTRAPEPQNPLASTVKIVMDKSHGSGVHIGNGYIVTAEHVIHGEKTVQTRDMHGQVRTAIVLWSHPEYDLALLWVDKIGSLPSSPMACATPFLGQEITAAGNPLIIEFVMSYGRVATAPHSNARWLEVVAISMPIAGGMSGGGVFDDKGRVIGVMVGMPLQGMGFSHTYVGYGYAVPSSIMCKLLAR